jgi:hypothetical protein
MKPFIDMMQSGQVWNAVEPEPPSRGAPPLAPLLAGARARGVADGFEWLGLAAILLDDRGEVLHVNPRAIDLMGEDLFLSSGRLRARDAEIDGALGVAIHRALGGGRSSHLAIPLKSGHGTVGARIAAMESLDDDPFQLLRAVAILEWDQEPSFRGEAQRH